MFVYTVFPRIVPTGTISSSGMMRVLFEAGCYSRAGTINFNMLCAKAVFD